MNIETVLDNPAVFWLLYMSPFLVGCLRRSKNLGLVFFMNLFLGWTVVAWFACWMLVFSSVTRAVVDPLVRRYQRNAAAGAPAPAGGAGQGPSSASGETPQPRDCSQCTNGRMTCPMCRGAPNRYEPPQGATGSPQLVSCTYCSASGSVQCTTCGGSGKIW